MRKVLAGGRWIGAAVATLFLLGHAEALDYLNVTVQPDRAVPGACFTFSAPLPRGAAGALDPYLSIEPKVDHGTEARGKDLCVTGLQHGVQYKVRLKAGLPAADTSTLAKDVDIAVEVPDRQGTVSFDGAKTLLPYTPGVGLPLKSVNVAKASLQIYRFDERALADGTTNDWFDAAVSGYSVTQIADRAKKLFEGTLDIKVQRNAEVATTIPIGELMKTLTPGVYVAVAIPAGTAPDEGDDRATQWFSVSDIGLLTVKTDGGLLVSARSLQTAQPLPGVDLRLIARSNEVLASLKTDADGRAVLPPGLLRGENADTAKLLTASSARGDFSYLQIDAPALDLTDLKLDGRTPPGPLDAFLWTDRGIYRPGETIHLGMLLRDDRARLTPQVPLVLHLVRPDGIEVDHFAPEPVDQRGWRHASTSTSPTMPTTGALDALGRIGRQGTARRGMTVSVQDFVPPRLEAKLDMPADDAFRRRQAPIAVTVSPRTTFTAAPARRSFGGQVDATIEPAEHPFPGFRRNTVSASPQEPFLPKALDPGPELHHRRQGHAPPSTFRVRRCCPIRRPRWKWSLNADGERHRRTCRHGRADETSAAFTRHALHRHPAGLRGRRAGERDGPVRPRPGRRRRPSVRPRGPQVEPRRRDLSLQQLLPRRPMAVGAGRDRHTRHGRRGRLRCQGTRQSLGSRDLRPLPAGGL